MTSMRNHVFVWTCPSHNVQVKNGMSCPRCVERARALLHEAGIARTEKAENPFGANRAIAQEANTIAKALMPEQLKPRIGDVINAEIRNMVLKGMLIGDESATMFRLIAYKDQLHNHINEHSATFVHSQFKAKEVLLRPNFGDRVRVLLNSHYDDRRKGVITEGIVMPSNSSETIGPYVISIPRCSLPSDLGFSGNGNCIRLSINGGEILDILPKRKALTPCIGDIVHVRFNGRYVKEREGFFAAGIATYSSNYYYTLKLDNYYNDSIYIPGTASRNVNNYVPNGFDVIDAVTPIGGV